MSSQIEAQNTYTQYSQLYQIAAQLNTQAQTDPSKAAEAQLASQQAHKAYAAYQAAWQKAYQDQKNLATQAVAAPAVGDNAASAAQHLLNNLIQQSAAATQQTPALNPLAGLPGIPAATPPAPATPAMPTANLANQAATLQNLQTMFQQQIQQASMQAAAAAAQAATQQIMGKNNTLPAPTGLANLPSPMGNEKPGYNNHRGGGGYNNRPYTPRNNYNNRGGYNNRYENQSAHDRLGSRPYVKQEVDFNQPLHKITGSVGQEDVHNVKDYAVLSTDSVFVEGLPYGVERLDVNDFFSQVGPLRVTANQQETGIGRIFLFLDENKKCNGTASVTFQQMDDAENCITLLNGKSFPVLRDDKVKTEKDDLMDQERSALGSPNSMGSRSEDEGDGGNYKRRGGSLNDILDDGKQQSTLVNDPTKVVTIQGRRNIGQVITEEMKLRPWLKFDDKKYWTFKGKLSIRMATLGERDPIGERRQKMGLPHQHNFAAKQQGGYNNRGMGGGRGGYQRGGYHRGRGGYNNHRGGYNQAGGKVYQTNIPTRQYPY